MCLLALLLLGGGLLAYAYFIEPMRLQVAHLSLQFDGVSEPVRLVAFSDTHIGNGTDAARIAQVMEEIVALQPDVVVFLGDLFDNYKEYQDGEEAQIAALLALPELPDVQKFAVYGNHDLGGGARRAYEQVLAQADYTLLVNEAVALPSGINLIGADDLIFGVPNAQPHVDPDAPNVLLVHEPDYADAVNGIDLQLSGHTHGGQVRIPFVDPFFLPKGGRNYLEGLHAKTDASLIYVTRGVGMSLLPLRFGAVPELTVIDITAKEGS